MSSISAEEIKVLSQYIYAISGVALDASKAYLLETRLKHLMLKYGCASYLDLHAKAKADRGGEMEKEIVDAITTNETLFFRDATPFEVFKHKILPDLIDARSKAFPGRSVPLRIWSAACSTGQEVYSIAIALREALGNLGGFQISILGTDISDEAVSKASYGKYNKFEIERGLPMSVLHKYFTPMGDSWRIKDELRAMATFKKFNLMKPFAGLGRFDVVFCRNVAIYFTPPDKKMVFEKIAGVLEADGVLIIGSTESLTGVTSVFEPKRYLRAIFYQPASGDRPSAMSASVPVAPVRPAMPVPSAIRPSASVASRSSLSAPRPAPEVASPRSIPSVSAAADNPPIVHRAQSEPKPSIPDFEPAVESSVPPAQLAQPARPAPVRPAPRVEARTSSTSHAGDKSALKRLLMKKKQETKA
jgi:chemotaxis protein methyltransferase CheR